MGSASTADEIRGAAGGSIFTVDGANSGTVDGLAFSAYENLLGRGGDDTFAFSGSGNLSGWLKGGLGTDTLDYSLYGSAVTVSLLGGTATGVTKGISSIENLIGSPFGNTIYGDNNDNIIIGTNAADTIYGLGGDDILIGLGGDDILDGGAGSDTVDYHLNTDSVTVILTTTGGTAVSGSAGNDTLLSIENVIGSNYDDDITRQRSCQPHQRRSG